MISRREPVNVGAKAAHMLAATNPGSCLSALLAVLVGLGILPSTAHAQWDKSTDWLFPCTALVEARFGTNHPLCDDVHSAGSIKATLDRASSWLEALGFESPALSGSLNVSDHMEDATAGWQEVQLQNHFDRRCLDRFCAWLVVGLGSFGQYSDSSLVLDPFRFSEDGELVPGYADGFGHTEVHELFHAVQFGYPKVEAAYDSDYVDWIIEGTAEHVTHASGVKLGLSAGGSTDYRYYDVPLHVPPDENPESPEFDAWQYGSWEFFDFLGEYLGSADGIKYLDHLLGTLAPDQKNGLLAVEAAVHAVDARHRDRHVGARRRPGLHTERGVGGQRRTSRPLNAGKVASTLREEPPGTREAM